MSDLHTNGTANCAPTGAQDDIVKRLRTAPPSMLGVRLEAADLIEAQQAEIERLRADIEAIHENALVNIERLRTALKVAANHMSMTGAPQTTIDAIRNAVRGG
jgi:uncharacterized hydantoinase/oxoprolinase family protein